MKGDGFSERKSIITLKQDISLRHNYNNCVLP